MIQSASNILVNGFPTTSMASSFNSNGLNLRGAIGFSLYIKWSGGTAAGSFKLQISSDSSTPPVNWNDLPSSSVSISGAGDQTWMVGPLYCGWVRVVYTATSGTGNVDVAELTMKGY